MSEPAADAAPSGPAASRADRLEQQVRERELDAYLVTGLTNIRWLTGFTGSNAACLAGPGRRTFFTDFRYAGRTATIEGWDVEIVSGEWLGGLASRLSGRIGVEDDRLTVRDFGKLEEAAGEGTDLIPSGGVVADLRRVKDRGELEAIAAAAELTDSIYLELIGRGLAGRTEIEVARFAMARMRDQGAEPSFPPIIAAGPNGALPHAEPSAREIGRGELVTIDMGSRLDGYCSDCTRTLASGGEGDLDGFAREIYGITLEAHRAGLAAITAGAGGADVDRVARQVIGEAGHGDHFGHGLGHGVGLEIHEDPRLGPHSKDVLRAGDVVTVEPGIYVPGRTGVRIEDMVAVGDPGIARNFATVPKELTFAGQR